MRPASSPEPGFGVSVVPLQYVSAQTLLKLMDSFATKAGSVRADTTRNLLLIQGTGAERRAAVDTALSFDVDWMRGQSVGIFPISSGTAGPDHRGTGKDRGFRRERSQPEHHQVSADRPSQRHHGGQQKAGAAAHGRDLDQAARSCGYRQNQRPRLSGEIRRSPPDRAGAHRHVHRRFVLRSARQRRQSDRTGIRRLRDVPAATVCRRTATSSLERQRIFDDKRIRLARRVRHGNGTSGFGWRKRRRRGERRAEPDALDGRSSGAGNGQPVLQDVRITPDTVNNTL